MMSALNPDGSPTEYMVGYYEEKAKGGAAIVTVGDTPVEELYPLLEALRKKRRYFRFKEGTYLEENFNNIADRILAEE